MSRIFLIFMVLLSTIGLSACNQTGSGRAALPEEITAVVNPFFEAVRRGDQKAAEKYVAPGFLKDSKTQFAEMSAILKKSPRLAPVIQQRQGNGAYLTFAGTDGKTWITSEVRVVGSGTKPMIEYWDVDATKEAPQMVAHVQSMKSVMRYGMIAVAIMALAGLAAVIWLVRNRTHLVAPEPIQEERRVAATVRNIES